MKKRVHNFSAFLLAALLAGGLEAANNRNQQENSTAKNQAQQQGANEARPKLTDENIGAAVEKKLKKLDGIDASALKVETKNRTVTITGTVDSLVESDRITEAVSAVRGVDGVLTYFTVKAEPRSDAEIQRDVQAALKFDPVTTAKDINVVVNDGAVRLTGKADSWSEKQLATWIASDVRGVRQVENQLTVASKRRSDAELKAALEQRFQSDPLVSDDIAVTVNNGRVKLSGDVTSALEKQWAIADARALNVTDVDASRLRVNAESDSSVSKQNANLSDQVIAGSIRATYVTDPRVFSFNPEVRVNDGHVTLSGTVDNLKAKQAAVQIAQNTAGVTRVTDNLLVRSATLSDAQVAQNLRDALERSVLVDAEDVTVNVNGGDVTLTGAVDSNFAKWAAGDIAARTRGVVQIRNQLVTDDRPELTAANYYYYPWHSAYWPWTYSYSTEPKSDWELHGDVRDQLAWSPFTDAEDISISVNDGVVTLTGEVDNRMEKGAAEDNAYQAGATRVKNQLVILEPTGR